MKLKGYRRPDGKFGIRNHVLVLPTSVCSTQLAMEISNKVMGCTYINNSFGCCQVAGDAKQTYKTVVNVGKNPNVGAIVVVGLGCEGVEPHKVAAELKETGKPVDTVVIQEEGGTLKAFTKGCEIARKFAEDLSKLSREDADISELVLAIECGGSDTTSGLVSNPACGVASDMIIAKGGTSILSETTEFIGAEHVLAKRAINVDVSSKLLNLVKNCEDRAKALGEDIRGGQPTPGNIEGGLTTIEEKSLGCIHKAGSAPLQDVLDYAGIPEGKGLYVMDTPGQDIESISGMVSGGAQIVIFTTGRGTPTGNPISPVIKITANNKTFENMKDNIDIDASSVIDGTKNIDQVGEEIFNEIINVCNGKLTKAEALGHKEFSIYKLAPTF